MVMPRYNIRHGMSWAPVLFLLGFLTAIGVVAYFLLIPMMRMANSSSQEERLRISTYAVLSVCILILILLAGLVFTLRMGRAVSMLSEKKKQTTFYTDAWKESARRMEVPTVEDLEEDDKGEKPMG